MTKKITNPEILAIRAAAEVDPACGRVWVGLDVGLKSTSVCVLDRDGKVVLAHFIVAKHCRLM